MKISKKIAAAGAIVTAGAVSAVVYAMNKRTAEAQRAERLAPKEIRPKASEVLSPQLTPEYLRFGGSE